MTPTQPNPQEPNQPREADMHHLPAHPLDAALRAWHDENRARAEAMRDDTIATAHASGALAATPLRLAHPIRDRRWIPRLAAAAALLATMVTLGILFSETSQKSAFAQGGMVLVPEGGELSALDENGAVLGPCPLQHTDVVAEASGPFVRTTIEQVYSNPYPRTIEALYTFPLSNAAAVDRMTMIVRGPSGEIVVESEVKERNAARMIYESARESGYVASLLEQERPNIFTQSVANIEPGATVRIRISTVELVQRRDGVYSWSFPTVVGPRYIPGRPESMPTLPDGFQVREGVVLRAPAAIETKDGCFVPAPRLLELLAAAVPLRTPDAACFDVVMQSGEPWRFDAKYGNGSTEHGSLWQSGIGEINGRWFYAKLEVNPGTGFSGNTDQVSDAARITPMPVHPTERAGHDISIRVNLDSGGAGIRSVTSTQHQVEIVETSATCREVTLAGGTTIPNKDFILSWQVANDSIEPAFFAHVDAEGSGPRPQETKGGYFLLMLEPPARVATTEVRPRELIFVLDTSGSMNGFPIEKAKEVMSKSIAKMRSTDVFNVITFAGDTRVLWDAPKIASPENIAAAQAMVERQEGGGGTEMMSAINAALIQPGRSALEPARLLELPADGRIVKVAVKSEALSAQCMTLPGGLTIPVELAVAMPAAHGKVFLLEGRWLTRETARVFAIDRAEFQQEDARTRYVMFLTDAYIGNDQGVIAAIRDNARASRVFSFGIGSSVNRYLIEEMARAGNGASDVVTLAEEADAVVERFVRRIENPILTDVEVSFDPALGATALLPGGGLLPDLFDQTPLVVLGRFDPNGKGAKGEAVVRGRTAAGAWEKRIAVEFPAQEPAHGVVETLWARAKVDDILLPHMAAVENESLDPKIQRQVVQIGESFHIATRYTSFVAVEKSRVTVGGRSMLVVVPIELPEGTNWAGFFGEGVRSAQAMRTDLATNWLGIEQKDAVGDALIETRFTDATRTLDESVVLSFGAEDAQRREKLDGLKQEFDGLDAGGSPAKEAVALGELVEPSESLARHFGKEAPAGRVMPQRGRALDRAEPNSAVGRPFSGGTLLSPPTSGGVGGGGGGGFGGVPVPGAPSGPGGNALSVPVLSPPPPAAATPAPRPTAAPVPSTAFEKEKRRAPQSSTEESSDSPKGERGSNVARDASGGITSSLRNGVPSDGRHLSGGKRSAGFDLESQSKGEGGAAVANDPSAAPSESPSPEQTVTLVLQRADLDLLARRLGRELALVAAAAELDLTTLPAILEGLGLSLDQGGRLQVAVLMEEVSKVSLDRLRATGARIVATERKLVILDIEPSELLKLARTHGVRKVDSLIQQPPARETKRALAA